MADLFSPTERSAIMRRVKSSGNASTEALLAREFRKRKITGWRRKMRLTGSPDFVWRRERLALFVDGCFWHGCPLHREIPASRIEYWKAKLERNARRDAKVNVALQAAGWTVIRIWECELRKTRRAETLDRLRVALESMRQIDTTPLGNRRAS